MYLLFVLARKNVYSSYDLQCGCGGRFRRYDGGLFSVGGIPVGVYLINAIEDKNVYYATMQAYIVLSDLYGSGVRIFKALPM